MKANNDIQALKAKHRLEAVMQETGEKFEINPKKPDQWRSTTTPGLLVDIRRQLYEIKKPGSDIETGDVFNWLRMRYGWTFGRALNYLRRRAPDSDQVIPLAKQEREIKPLRKDRDEIEHLDQCQERALAIAGEMIRPFFSWSLWDLVMFSEQIRIEPVHAPAVDACQRCGRSFAWRVEKTIYQDPSGIDFHMGHVGALPVIAYAIKRRVKLSDLDMGESDDVRKLVDALIDMVSLFAEDEDGVVCAKCAWKELDFQIALDLCKQSAQQREDTQLEARMNAEHEEHVASCHEIQLQNADNYEAENL